VTTRRSGILAAVFAALFFMTSAALAAQRIGDFVIYSEADMIALNGQIGPGTVGDFHRALKARPRTRIVLLESPGGDVDAALQLAAEIRRLGLSTVIPKGFVCYSACSYLFFAGREHVVKGSLGVHRVSAEGWNEARGQVYDGDVRAALRRYGANAGVIKAMVSTPPSRLHVFSPSEISRLSINRTAGQKSLAVKYAAM
jgi:hypothetical protein